MNEILYQALCACLGLSPASEEASVLIREAYQEPENAPRAPRNADVVYYSAEPDRAGNEPPAAYANENPGSSSHVPAVSGFAAYKMVVVCYGPNAETNARKIRGFLYVDGNGYPRSILRKAGVYLVPDPPEVLVLHELEGGLWRLRADVVISLRVTETLSHSNRRNAITVAPAVVVHAGN